MLDCIAGGTFDQNGLIPNFDEVMDKGICLLFEPPVEPSDRYNVSSEKTAVLCSKIVWPTYHENSYLLVLPLGLRKESTEQYVRLVVENSWLDNIGT